MRRRGERDRLPVPDELLVFDGREHATQTAWMAAFDAWHTARDAWTAEHSGQQLPSKVLSDCPFDPSLI